MSESNTPKAAPVLRESATFDRLAIQEIQRAAETGIYDIRGGGTKRKLPHFDDLLLLGASESWRNWMLVLQMPLTFAGIGLVHAMVDRYRLAQSWLVVFYVLWVFLMPLRWLVQMLAVIDSFIDVRKRLPAPKVGE